MGKTRNELWLELILNCYACAKVAQSDFKRFKTAEDENIWHEFENALDERLRLLSKEHVKGDCQDLDEIVCAYNIERELFSVASCGDSFWKWQDSVDAMEQVLQRTLKKRMPKKSAQLKED